MKLNVLSPVNHDGVDYAIGDTVDIKDKATANALIEAGAAKEAGKKSKAEERAEAEAEAAAAAALADAAAETEAALAQLRT